MTFPLAVLLVRVGNCDFFVHEKLVVHGFDGFVGAVEVVERDEAEAAGNAIVISCDLPFLLAYRYYIEQITVEAE